MSGLDTHTHRTTTVTLAAHARRGLIIYCQENAQCVNTPLEYRLTLCDCTEVHIENPQIASKPPAFEPLDRIRGYVSNDRVMRLREDLSQASGATLGFHQVWPDIRQQAQLVKQFYPLACQTITRGG